MTKPPEPATPQAEHQDCTCSASLTSQPAAVADGETESREVESLQPSASNAQVTPVLLASSQSHPPSDRAGPPTCRHSVKKGPSSVLSSCLWVGGEMRVREGGSQTPLGGPPGSQGTLSPHCRGWGAAHFHHPQWRPPSSGAPPPPAVPPQAGPRGRGGMGPHKPHTRAHSSESVRMATGRNQPGCPRAEERANRGACLLRDPRVGVEWPWTGTQSRHLLRRERTLRPVPSDGRGHERPSAD